MNSLPPCSPNDTLDRIAERFSDVVIEAHADGDDTDAALKDAGLRGMVEELQANVTASYSTPKTARKVLTHAAGDTKDG